MIQPPSDGRCGRLAVVTSSFPFGTGEGFLAAEIAALAHLGIQVDLIPLWPRGKRRDWTAPEALRLVEVPRWNLRPDAGSASVLLRALQTGQRTRKINSSGGLLRSARRELLSSALGDALARHVRRAGVSHIHAYWATGPATAAMHAARKAEVAWSFSAHSGDISGNADLARKCRSAKWVRFVSEYGREQAWRQGARPAVAHVVHVGVQTPSTPRPDPGPRRSGRLLCVARLTPVKGLEHLVEAVRLLHERNHDVRLDIAGEGPERGRVQRTIDAKGLSGSVRLLGHIPNSEVLSWYREPALDLVVLPSISLGERAEGIPVALMEPMASGVPVVATKTGGIPELVPVELDLLAEAGDAVGLADRIERLLCEPDHYRAASVAARNQIRAHFDSRIESEKLARILLEDCHPVLPG